MKYTGPTFLDERLSNAPTTKTSTNPAGRPGPAMSLNYSMVGADETILNLKNLSLAIRYKAALLLSEIGIDLLSKALPKTPVDSGQLRESGEVILKFTGAYSKIASGMADGSINTSNPQIPVSRLANTSKMDLLVQFYRTNEFGEDIALWAHEDLYPSGSSQRPHALQPGTGPKYLEQPWLENVNDYIGRLYEVASIRDSIKNATKTIRKARSKTDVDVITLNPISLLAKVTRRAGRR